MHDGAIGMETAHEMRRARNEKERGGREVFQGLGYPAGKVKHGRTNAV